MIKDKLLVNAKKLHLDTHQEVLDEIAKDWEFFEKKLEAMQKIDTKDIKPLTHPVEKTTSYMREDVEGQTLDKDIILSNAPEADNDYILVTKVVKND